LPGSWRPKALSGSFGWISVNNHTGWTDDDVIAYLEEITALGQRVSAAATITHFPGAMMGPRERRVLVDWLEREGISAQQRTCLLADSVLLRGAVTAYAWMTGTEGRAFDPADRRRACEWTCASTRATANEVERALAEHASASTLMRPAIGSLEADSCTSRP